MSKVARWSGWVCRKCLYWFIVDYKVVYHVIELILVGKGRKGSLEACWGRISVEVTNEKLQYRYM